MLLHQLPHVRMVHEGFLGDVLLLVALAMAAPRERLALRRGGVGLPPSLIHI